MLTSGKQFSVGLTVAPLGQTFLTRSSFQSHFGGQQSLRADRVPAAGPRHTCLLSVSPEGRSLRRTRQPRLQPTPQVEHSPRSGHRLPLDFMRAVECVGWGGVRRAKCSQQRLQCSESRQPRISQKMMVGLLATRGRAPTHDRGQAWIPSMPSPPPWFIRPRPGIHPCQTEMLGPCVRLLVTRTPGLRC